MTSELAFEPAPSVGRLQATFESTPFSSHGTQWDQLWKESYTPWDRGGPSMALNDLLEQHRELFPSSSTTTGRPRALVPGCGRGHDVLLLSAFGYDVTGFDVSENSLREAAANEQKHGGDEVYKVRKGVAEEKGTVKWVNGDFFDEGREELKGGWDLIYDYTFFCALPVEGRPKWAKRMSELLKPDGRLVCLEWPLKKSLSTGGPPWGVSAEAYLAHLSHPGEDIEYDENGPAMNTLPKSPGKAALRQLARIKPARTHKSGCDEDGNVDDHVSIWAH